MPFKTPNQNSEYIRPLLARESDELLLKIYKYGEEQNIPALLPETAALLKQLIILKRPENILEIGTGAGYSGALMLLRSPESTLVTIDNSEARLSAAKRYFAGAGLTQRVTAFLDDAAAVLPALDAKFDFILLDGPKAQYIEYLPFLKRLLAGGGVLFCDNVLYTNHEMAKGAKSDGFYNKIDLFLKTLCADNELLTSIIQVGDGVALAIKL